MTRRVTCPVCGRAVSVTPLGFTRRHWLGPATQCTGGARPVRPLSEAGERRDPRIFERTVALRNGAGTITLTASLDAKVSSEEDRAFVVSLGAMCDSYEASKCKP